MYLRLTFEGDAKHKKCAVLISKVCMKIHTAKMKRLVPVTTTTCVATLPELGGKK